MKTLRLIAVVAVFLSLGACSGDLITGTDITTSECRPGGTPMGSDC